MRKAYKAYAHVLVILVRQSFEVQCCQIVNKVHRFINFFFSTCAFYLHELFVIHHEHCMNLLNKEKILIINMFGSGSSCLDDSL